MTRTLLAVHAHPDDETILTGGTLARYSAEGVRTIVVTCTHGDLGEVAGLEASRGVSLPASTSPFPARAAAGPPLHAASEPMPPGEGLIHIRDSVASIRDGELEAAAECLGVSRLANLGYFDSGMAGWPENHRPGAFFAAPLAEAADRLLEVMRQERPQVMVCYDQTGGYGHPDHVKAHQVAVAAYAASEASVRPAKLYVVRIPLTWAREFVQSLREAGIDAPASAAAGADAGPDVHEIGVPDHLVTTAIDVAQYVPFKRAALAKHASQMPPDHFLMRMPPTLAARLWRFEYFSREHGPTLAAPGETEADLFSGLA